MSDFKPCDRCCTYKACEWGGCPLASTPPKPSRWKRLGEWRYWGDLGIGVVILILIASVIASLQKTHPAAKPAVQGLTTEQKVDALYRDMKARQKEEAEREAAWRKMGLEILPDVRPRP